MSEGKNVDSKNPEIVSAKASNLATFVRRHLDGEFIDVFSSNDEIGLPSAEDTLIDSEGSILGNLLAERIVRPESKDLILTFMPSHDPELAAETIKLRIPRYGGVAPYYEYSKVLNGEGGSPEPLKNTQEAEQAIKTLSLKVGQMLGVSPEE